MARTLTRRQVLTAVPLGLLFGRGLAHALEDGRSTQGYQMNLSVLFNLFTLSLSGTVTQEIDRRAGKYRVVTEGQGTAMSTRSEATGLIQNGRFKPLEMRAVHLVRGLRNTSNTTYDYARERAEIHGVTHTLLLGRPRQVDDVLTLPRGRPVDDLVSAALNFAADTLEHDADGTYYTWVIRRARAENEGPDDVSPDGYRAELVPLRFRPTADPATGRLAAQIDITRFSSWARAGQPAQLTFGRDRQLESVQSALLYGTTLSVRVTA